jgi:hypothetical protein
MCFQSVRQDEDNFTHYVVEFKMMVALCFSFEKHLVDLNGGDNVPIVDVLLHLLEELIFMTAYRLTSGSLDVEGYCQHGEDL